MREAAYSSQDEIHLIYLDAAGIRCDLFYSPRQYARRQAAHGKTLYPDPKPL